MLCFKRRGILTQDQSEGSRSLTSLSPYRSAGAFLAKGGLQIWDQEKPRTGGARFLPTQKRRVRKHSAVAVCPKTFGANCNVSDHIVAVQGGYCASSHPLLRAHRDYGKTDTRIRGARYPNPALTGSFAQNLGTLCQTRPKPTPMLHCNIQIEPADVLLLLGIIRSNDSASSRVSPLPQMKSPTLQPMISNLSTSTIP